MKGQDYMLVATEASLGDTVQKELIGIFGENKVFPLIYQEDFNFIAYVTLNGSKPGALEKKIQEISGVTETRFLNGKQPN